MSKAARARMHESIASSYFELTRGLLPETFGVAIFDSRLALHGQHGCVDAVSVRRWIEPLLRDGNLDVPTAHPGMGGDRLAAIPLRDEGDRFIGAFVVAGHAAGARRMSAAETALRLRPITDLATRELASLLPAARRSDALVERTAELEWLFDLTSNLQRRDGDDSVLQQLLAAATRHLRCRLGALVIPAKRLHLEWSADREAAGPLSRTLASTQAHLLQLAQRSRKPLLINGSGGGDRTPPTCKLMSIPIVRQSGRVLGFLAFLNPASAPNFSDRKRFLAGHLGRQVMAILEAQFDLMTGLYTRSAFEQMYATITQPGAPDPGHVIYLDVDRMHLLNEIHGFEIGDELIVRIADLMCPPLLPDGAISARITGDRFAMLLPSTDRSAATAVAQRLCDAASRLVIGPAENPVTISVSCGVAPVVDIPQAVDRALASAEIACKAAKDHGRGRVEFYALDDTSITRRTGDVMRVWVLREALKADRMELYAQRIVPLRNPELPHSYELLVRMRDVDGELLSPTEFIGAAQRYQLLPSIDRWVFERAMQMLAPIRSVLLHARMSMSLNVSGQSIGDDVFIERFVELLRTSGLPRGSVMLEITEQSALASLPRTAAVMQRLGKLGCRFALDDFGTGSNSLTYLKNLPVSRVKIDGSFVRDMLTNVKSFATVRAVRQLVEGMDIDTVAEYVETEEIALRLASLGVDYAQGFAYSRPEPLSEVLQHLQDAESLRWYRVGLEEI